MEVIGLEGMRFFAKHGVDPEEEIVGTEFLVDIYIEKSFEAAAAKDDVNMTTNYAIVYKIIESVMHSKKKLIETVAYNIINEVKERFDGIESIKVVLKKCPPPLGKDIKNAIVILEKNFVKKCAKCGTKMTCYHDSSCWCMGYDLPPKLANHLKVTYNNCLCADCLDGFLAQ